MPSTSIWTIFVGFDSVAVTHVYVKHIYWKYQHWQLLFSGILEIFSPHLTTHQQREKVEFYFF